MTSKLGVKRGDTVMVVDDQQTYSTSLAAVVAQQLTAKGVKVDRVSVTQQQTDFSATIARLKPTTKVVYMPFQMAAQAQAFAQQLKQLGKRSIPFGSDSIFDKSKFSVSGAYISFFAPDVTTMKEDAAVVAAFKKRFAGTPSPYGDPSYLTSPFGPPAYVAAQVYAYAAARACRDGKLSRAEMRQWVAKTRIPSTILGVPLRFTANGDPVGARYRIFKVVDGKYVTVS
jgi:ABC-type branched-subunit amino acid transport system substrate-binding protein